MLLAIVRESFEGGIQTLWDKQEVYRENWEYLGGGVTMSHSVKMGKGASWRKYNTGRALRLDALASLPVLPEASVWMR